MVYFPVKHSCLYNKSSLQKAALSESYISSDGGENGTVANVCFFMLVFFFFALLG